MVGAAKAAVSVGIANLMSLGTMMRVNFMIGSDYRWLIASIALCSFAGVAVLGLSVRRVGF